MPDDFSDLPQAVRRFRKCPGCTYDWATGEGVRGCNYYDCPYLPAEMQVTCDWCGYNFFLQDGQVRCDHSTCVRALTLHKNAATYHRWRAWLAAQQRNTA
ncbi:MAG: hypothetical protein ACE5KX_09095 [Acidimicrobiia bacterium]